MIHQLWQVSFHRLGGVFSVTCLARTDLLRHWQTWHRFDTLTACAVRVVKLRNWNIYQIRSLNPSVMWCPIHTVLSVSCQVMLTESSRQVRSASECVRRSHRQCLRRPTHSDAERTCRADSVHSATPDTTRRSCLCRVQCELLWTCSDFKLSVGDSLELSGIQFTPPKRTRQRQDSVVGSVNCARLTLVLCTFQLGDVVGHERLHANCTRRQHVRHCPVRHLPSRLNCPDSLQTTNCSTSTEPENQLEDYWHCCCSGHVNT